MFIMVDYMTVKKSCKYGDYGLFEHLLFLLGFVCVCVCVCVCVRVCVCVCVCVNA